MEEGGGRERGGFVGVGAVDGDVKGLIGYLPEEDAAGLLLKGSAVAGFGLRGLWEGGKDF